MDFLAVNTAGESVEVALKKGDKTYVAFDPEYKKASEVLLPLIHKVFVEADADISDVDYFACCIGPGSFTGIRIGLSTVRAFCQSLNKPALAVTNTLVLSYNGVGSKRGNVVSLSDAGNGYRYVAVYDENGNSVVNPKCVETAGVAEFLAGLEKPYTVCCDTLSADLAPNAVVHKVGGDALVRAVLHEEKRVGPTEYNSLEPLYVRKSQAESLLDG